MTASPLATTQFLEFLRSSGLLNAEKQASLLSMDLPPSAEEAAAVLVEAGWITKFQSTLLLQGKYKGFRLGSHIISDLIGRGGMGSVYLAEHQELRRKVAIKILVSVKDVDAKLAQDRFLREARAAAALDHPNIVRIFDVVRQGNTLYLVMEYVNGENLQTLLSRVGVLPYPRAVELIAQAAAGLQHAHEKGFVHRDIKPANIMVDASGVIKILDMGLARSNQNAEDNLTEVLDNGAIVGTADFISPEQALNSTVDIRADIYSLGATFFALVTGKPPFEGSTTQKLLQHQLKDPPSLKSLNATMPDELTAVMLKMLAKRPEMRYSTPAEVIDALSPWLTTTHRVNSGLSHSRLAGSSDVRLGLLDTSLGGSSRRMNFVPGSGGSSTILKDIEPMSGETAKAIVSSRLTPAPQPHVERAPQWMPEHPADSATQLAPKAKASAPRKNRKPLIVLTVAGLFGLGVAAAILAGGSSSSKSASAPEERQEVPKPSVAVETSKPITSVASETVNVPAKNLASSSIFALDLGKIAPFDLKLDGKKVIEGDASKLPPSVSAYAIPGNKGEVSLSVNSDGPSIKIVSTEGTPASGLVLNLESPDKPLIRAATYSVQVEYRAENSARFHIFAMSPLLKALYPEASFGSTKGEWKTVRVEFRRGADPMQIVLRAAALGEKNAIFIRRADVRETADPSVSPPNNGLIQTLTSKDQLPFSSMSEYPLAEPERSKGSRTVVNGGANKPTSWTGRAAAPGCQVEFCYEDGVNAFGLRNLGGPGGASLYSPYFTAPSGVIRMQLEYQYTGAIGQARVTFNALDGSTVRDILVLKPTEAGAWGRADVVFDLHDETSGQIQFQNIDPRPDGVLYIRSYQLTELARSVAPKLTEIGMVYQSDIASIAKFQNKKLGSTRLEGDPEKLPPGLRMSCYESKSSGQFCRTTLHGEPVLGIGYVSGGTSVQLAFELEDQLGCSLQPGDKYLVRVVYRTTPEATGNLYIQNTSKDSAGVTRYRTSSSTKMPTSVDSWATTALEFTRVDGLPARLTISPRSPAGDQMVYIKSVEVVEVK